MKTWICQTNKAPIFLIMIFCTSLLNAICNQPFNNLEGPALNILAFLNSPNAILFLLLIPSVSPNKSIKMSSNKTVINLTIILKYFVTFK